MRRLKAFADRSPASTVVDLVFLDCPLIDLESGKDPTATRLHSLGGNPHTEKLRVGLHEDGHQDPISSASATAKAPLEMGKATIPTYQEVRRLQAWPYEGS